MQLNKVIKIISFHEIYIHFRALDVKRFVSIGYKFYLDLVFCKIFVLTHDYYNRT